MSRLQGILAAGGLTGIVVASSVALGAGSLLTPPTPTPVVEYVGGSSTNREMEYQQQIEAANGTILQLEAQIDAMAAGGSGDGGTVAPNSEIENESEDEAHDAEQQAEQEKHDAEQQAEQEKHEAEQQQESGSQEEDGG